MTPEYLDTLVVTYDNSLYTEFNRIFGDLLYIITWYNNKDLKATHPSLKQFTTEVNVFRQELIKQYISITFVDFSKYDDELNNLSEILWYDLVSIHLKRKYYITGKGWEVL